MKIESLDLLVSYIHDISISCGCQFVSKQTGLSRSTQIFACHFHNTIYKCNACVKFYLEHKTNVIHLEEINNQHSHAIGEVYPNKNRNSLTHIQRKNIENRTIDGQSAQTIKQRECLSCSKNVLYGARRKTLKKFKEDEIKILLETLCDFNNWINVLIIDETDKFRSCYCVHCPILQSKYSKDIVLLDDTSCTNFYGKPLLAFIVEDENGKEQLLSFSIMENRCKSSFISFFVHIKKLIGDIRVFITDRNFSQIESLEIVWPNAHIIYCLRHIKKNIGDTIGSEMKKKFQQMMNKEISEAELIQVFEKYISEHDPESQASSMLSSLLLTRERWLPSLTAAYCHRGNSTTNKIEGFFGAFKNFTEHRIQSLGQLAKSLFICAENLFVTSRNIKQLYLPDRLMSKEDCSCIGNYVLEKINKEFNILTSHRSKTDYGPLCCEVHQIFEIPCRHLIHERMKSKTIPYLTINDIHPRWQHNYHKNII